MTIEAPPLMRGVPLLLLPPAGLGWEVIIVTESITEQRATSALGYAYLASTPKTVAGIFAIAREPEPGAPPGQVSTNWVAARAPPSGQVPLWQGPL